MKLSRRSLLSAGAGAAVLAAWPRRTIAQSYPARPVRIIVSFPPGGPTDITARIVGQSLSDRFGQPVVIENRGGASGNIGTEAVVHAAPDGYTLLLTGTYNAINAALYEKLNFSFLDDIVPVATLIRFSNVMVVHPSIPARTVPEFIAYAKAHPGKIDMASPGNGTSQHLSGELFKAMANVDLVHVPYRGSGPALTDLIGGQVQVMFDAIPSAIGHIKSGKLRALGVTAAGRSEALPDVPSIGEFVPGYEASAVLGIGAPKNTLAAIVERLNREINIVLAEPNVKSRLAELGGTALQSSPGEYAAFIVAETAKWAGVIRAAGVKVE
jgi:tripartite-type tricarboxylate transporter receptor subunit TctC